jgi:hypothetical protein
LDQRSGRAAVRSWKFNAAEGSSWFLRCDSRINNCQSNNPNPKWLGVFEIKRFAPYYKAHPVCHRIVMSLSQLFFVAGWL